MEGHKDYAKADNITATVAEGDWIQSLEARMKRQDWNYTHSDHPVYWLQEHLGHRNIEKCLQLLAATDEGKIKANDMWERYVPAGTINKPEFLHSKNISMEDNAKEFNEGQFKRVGFAEAFTPEVQQKMERGDALIQHKIKKEYDGDKVDATLYLKKSSTSDFYFLNKYDLELQKAGQETTTKQTFFVSPKIKDDNHPEKSIRIHFTLKEAYNLLAGRPVYKDMINKQEEQYKAWNLLNTRKILGNGNYEVKQYNNNYGFNLEAVLKNYPIKELANEQYKQSLLDSLHRGNLQLATFVGKDNREEKLYVSPAITTGSLNIYDADKKRIPLDNQLDRQIINKDFADQLTERFKEKANHTQATKQDVKQTETIQPKQGKAQKQAKEGPKNTRSRSKKVGR